MNDRELLELAAKAAGDPNIRPAHPDFTRYIGRNEDMGCDVFARWNPLADDGDAFRLAVRLEMDLFVRAGWSEAVAPMHAAVKTMHGNDSLASTRRAVVRAAAEIGKAMKE